MATRTSQPTPKDTATAPVTIQKKLMLMAGIFCALAMVWVGYNFSSIKGQAELGTSYAAHIACSCRYIEGRPLDACYNDFEPGMGLVSLTDDQKNRRIKASVPMLAAAVAEYRSEFGCQQLNEAEIQKLD